MDTKEINKSRKSKDRQTDNDIAKDKEQTTIYKALHKKLKIEQHEPH